MSYALILREDGKRLERICEHGVGHPVGSIGKWERWMGVHGCDGCCSTFDNEPFELYLEIENSYRLPKLISETCLPMEPWEYKP